MWFKLTCYIETLITSKVDIMLMMDNHRNELDRRMQDQAEKIEADLGETEDPPKDMEEYESEEESGSDVSDSEIAPVGPPALVPNV